MNQYNIISIRNILRPVEVRAKKHQWTVQGEEEGKKDDKFAQRVSTNRWPHVARSHAHNPTI